MDEKELGKMIKRLLSKDFAKLSEEEKYERTLEFIRTIDENNIPVMLGDGNKNTLSLLNVIKILGHETVARVIAQRIPALVSDSNLYEPEDIKRMREKMENGTGTEEDETILKAIDEMKNSQDNKDGLDDEGMSDMPSFLYGLSFLTLNYMKNTMVKDNVENMLTSSMLMVPMLLLIANNLVNDGYYASHGSQYKTIDDSKDDLDKALTDAREKAKNVVNVLSKDKDLTERLGLKGMSDDVLAIIALGISIMYCKSSVMDLANISDIMEAMSIEEACSNGKEFPPKFDGSMFSKSKFKEMTNDEGKSFLMDD